MTTSFSLNQSQIKIIALICMAIDHLTQVLAPELPDSLYFAGRAIGRIAFPVFAYMLVEGFFHTRNRNRHLELLFIFALISEIPFDLAENGTWLYLRHQNVFFTLFFGFLGMTLLENASPARQAAALVLAAVAEFTCTDYGAAGVLTVYAFYLIAKRHNNPPCRLAEASPAELLSALIPLLFTALSWKIQFFCILAVPLLCLYNGKRGRGLKYFFYLFYPLHFLIFWAYTQL